MTRPALSSLLLLALVATGCDLFFGDDDERGPLAIVEGLVDLELFEDVPRSEIHLFAHVIDADGGSSEIVGMFATPDADGRYRIELPVPDGETLDLVVKTTREGRNPRTRTVIRARALVSGPVAPGTAAFAAPLSVESTAAAQVYLAARQLVADDEARRSALGRVLTPAAVTPWVGEPVASALALGNEDDVALARCRCRPGLWAEAVLDGLEAFDAALRSPVVGAGTDVLEALASERADARRALDAFVSTARLGETDAARLAGTLDLDAFARAGLSAADRALAYHAAAAATRFRAEARNLFDDPEARAGRVGPLLGRRLAGAAHLSDAAAMDVLLTGHDDGDHLRADLASAAAALETAIEAGDGAAGWAAYGTRALALADLALGRARPEAADGITSAAFGLGCAGLGAPGWPGGEGADDEEGPRAGVPALVPIVQAAEAATADDPVAGALPEDLRDAVAALVAGAFMRAFAPSDPPLATVSGRVGDADEPIFVAIRRFAPGDATGELVGPVARSDAEGRYEALACRLLDEAALVVARDTGTGEGLARGLVPGLLGDGDEVVVAPLDADATAAASWWAAARDASPDPASVVSTASVLSAAHPEVTGPVGAEAPSLRALFAEALADGLGARAVVLAGADADGRCCDDPDRIETLTEAEAAAWRADGVAREGLAEEGAWPPDAATEASLRDAVRAQVAEALAAEGVDPGTHLFAEIAFAYGRLSHLAHRDPRRPSTAATREIVHWDLASRVVAAHAVALATLGTDAADEADALHADLAASLGRGDALRAAWAAYDSAVFGRIAAALDALEAGAGEAFLDLGEAFAADATAHAAALFEAGADRGAVAAAWSTLADAVTARVSDSALGDLDADVQAAVEAAVGPLLALRAFDTDAMP